MKFCNVLNCRGLLTGLEHSVLTEWFDHLISNHQDIGVDLFGRLCTYSVIPYEYERKCSGLRIIYNVHPFAFQFISGHLLKLAMNESRKETVKKKRAFHL